MEIVSSKKKMNYRFFSITFFAFVIIITAVYLYFIKNTSDYELTRANTIETFIDNKYSFIKIKDYLNNIDKLNIPSDLLDNADLMTITISNDQMDLYSVSMNVFTACIDGNSLTNQKNSYIILKTENESIGCSLKKIFESGIKSIEANYSKPDNLSINFIFNNIVAPEKHEVISIYWYSSTIPTSKVKVLFQIEGDWYYSDQIYG